MLYEYAIMLFIHALKSLKKINFFVYLFQLNFSMHSQQTNDSLEEEAAVEGVLEEVLGVSLEGEEIVGAQEAMVPLKNPVMEPQPINPVMEPLPINPVMGPLPINLPMEGEEERVSKIFNYQCQVSTIITI